MVHVHMPGVGLQHPMAFRFLGQPGFATENGTGFIVPIEVGTPQTISAGDFEWPSFSHVQPGGGTGSDWWSVAGHVLLFDTVDISIIKVEFEARDGKIYYGFDPKETVRTGGPCAWASGDKDSTSDVPKIVIEPAAVQEPYNEQFVRGFAAGSPFAHAVVFTDGASEHLALTVAHEVGHLLGLAFHNGDGFGRDAGPPPAGLKPWRRLPAEEGTLTSG